MIHGSKILMNLRQYICLVLLCAAFMTSNARAQISVALVSGDDGEDIANVLDMATALVDKDADLQLLDRVEVDRVLKEHQLSLGGLEQADQAVKAGQLLHVDLFAVLEANQPNASAGKTYAMVVFDAKSGARYADSALVASNDLTAASATAAAVRAAVVKRRQDPQNLHTVGLLAVRNDDLPLEFNDLCDSVGLLLERELTASPGIAVLERRRLEQVNKERSVAPDAEENRLLSSLQMIELDIGQDGAGLRGTITLVGAGGKRGNKIAASVPTRDPAALAHLLAVKARQFLNVPAGGVADRAAEAERFHGEYLLLLEHGDYLAAVHVLDAALALSPEQIGWQREMVSLLLNAAIELIDPRGENWDRPLENSPTTENLARSLTLGMRGADLLLQLSQEAAQRFKPGNSIPEILVESSRKPLGMLLEKLADVSSDNPVVKSELAKLGEIERTLRVNVIEPFYSKNTHDSASFENYSRSVRLQFWPPYHLKPEEAQQILTRWIDMSHKFNPPDGSGNYWVFNDFLFISHFTGGQLTNFMQNLGSDQDPLIRVYAHAGLVTLVVTSKSCDQPFIEPRFVQ